MTDGFSGITTKFTYDSIKRMTSMITSTGFRLSLGYDDKNRVSNMTESISGTGITNKKTEYNYNSLGIIENVKTTQNNTELTTTYQFDDLYRMHISTLKLKAGETEQEVLRNTYKYKDGELAGSTTNYVEQHVINDRTYDYTYDVRGNITQISLNGTVIATYTYDEFDQLISETANGVTTTWTYDAGGIMLTKSHNNTIIEYKYEDSEWKDLLTSYNGKTIAYDDIGNPLSIGTDTTLTWEAGRRLASITKAGVTTSFTYNADGYRTAKTSGGVTTTYHLDGSRITAMLKGTDELSFAYDENGLLTGLYHNGTAYAYAKNLQGDIIGIIDGSGNWVVTYEYDAWGNPITTSGTLKDTLGQLNPFRYRGYVYDAETGFYYVSSRYYNPEIGRFLNADGQIANVGGDILGYNTSAYCMNNPVNMSDQTGNWPKWATKLAVAVAVVATVAVVAAVTVATAGAGTAIAAVAVGAAKGAAIGLAVGAATGAASGAISHRVSTGSWKGAGEAALNGMGNGALTGAIGGAITGGLTGGLNNSVCFVAGTSILTAIGHVAIEDIVVGDEVWAKDPETGEKELKKVVQTFVNKTDELVHVYVKGEKIVTTPEHPFYTPTKGWISAIHLRAGDLLVLQSGKYIIVEKVQHEILESPMTVYNFEVEDFHTYYVSDSAILVHNTCGAKSTPNQIIKNDIINLPRTGSALKNDAYHAFSNIVDNYAGYATKSSISNGTLYQLPGSLNGVAGRFEWIVQNHSVTHRMFVKGGTINGIPIMP